MILRAHEGITLVHEVAKSAIDAPRVGYLT